MNQIHNNDTIAAISSGLTKSGIGVIRVSGPDSRSIVEKIFTTRSGRPIKLSEPSHIYYGFLHNVSRETSDEVLVLNMPAPHSFTGEDVVEIDCHGGILMMQRVLEAVVEQGAEHAEPGEFTKRAFLNGRIDLAQAESVIDIINAGNDEAIKTSVSQLGGNLSHYIHKLREKILHEAAFIEAALDDPEHYSLDGYKDNLNCVADDVITELEKLISGFDRGRHISNGIETVIIGRPNAGKSSLMNALLGEERAIVTQVPGTTRDTISEMLSVGSVMLRLTDTAGLRESSDEVERIGIERTLANADNAELILCVIDGTDAKHDAEYASEYDSKFHTEFGLKYKLQHNLEQNSEEGIEKASEKDPEEGVEKASNNYSEEGVEKTSEKYSEEDSAKESVKEFLKSPDQLESLIRLAASKKCASIYIINKTDIADEADISLIRKMIDEIDTSPNKLINEISAKNGSGVEQLCKSIEQLFGMGEISYSDNVIVTSARHADLLKSALDSMLELKNSINLGMSEDFYSVDLMNAYAALGRIIGEDVDEDLVNEIFSKFCMGK